MDSLHFFQPVRISLGSDQPAVEIESVDQAMNFLHEWPVGRRGPVYRCALNCCSAAIAAQLPAEDARRSFASFARITGILAAEAPHPATFGTTGSFKPLAK